MKKLFLFLILLNGCSFTDSAYFNSKNNKLNKDETISFKKDYTMNEYKLLLDKYSKENHYPNMDK